MRLKYSKKDFQKTYNSIVKEAEKAFSCNRLSEGIKYICCAAFYQYNLNIQLTDERLDNLIIKLSERIVPLTKDYTSQNGNVILYDSSALDNRGLTQQYLDALYHTEKYNILLVHDTFFSKNSIRILNFCKQHNIATYELGSGTFEERELKLINLIKDFKPEKVLFHLFPFDILPLSTFYAFKAVTKYQINLTDHGFWLGASLIDYSCEFRNWGATLSICRRHLKKEQLLLLPYYPWQEKSVFQGFPEQVKNKVIVFAGGALYKIEGGHGYFYSIVKRILEENHDVVFLFAGDGDRTHINKFILDNHFEDRFLLLGNRKDINEVVKHIDIYLNTYPMIGGLMSQYAAVNGKPILTFKDKQVEDVVCLKGFCNIAIEDFDELIEEANRLIRDPGYRKEKGDLMKSLILDQNEFRESFTKSFETNTSTNEVRCVTIDDKFYDAYPERINEGKKGFDIENQVKNDCPQALHWKMILNLYWATFRHRIHITRIKVFRMMFSEAGTYK